MTGPVIDATPPVIALGPVIAPTVRHFGQGGLAGFIVNGAILFDVVPLDPQQAAWLTVALGFVLALVQNMIETRVGRRLVGVR